MTFDEFAIKVFGANFPNDATIAEFAKSPDARKAAMFWVVAKCHDAEVIEPDEAVPTVTGAYVINAVEAILERLAFPSFRIPEAANDPFKGGRF